MSKRCQKVERYFKVLSEYWKKVRKSKRFQIVLLQNDKKIRSLISQISQENALKSSKILSLPFRLIIKAIFIAQYCKLCTL